MRAASFCPPLLPSNGEQTTLHVRIQPQPTPPRPPHAPVHYQPDHFPPDKRLEWHRLAPLIGPTAAAVARYDCLIGSVPNPLALLATLRVQEAVCSSRIENIFADVGTVLELDAGVEPANPYVRSDAREVLNYLAAERRALELIGKSPLSLRIVCEAHAVLLSGEHGRGKSPGEFRRAPVWIGGPGSTPDTATFVPAHAAQVPEGMSAWERYIHAGAPDRLVQIAVQHAKFEAVHPFLDGNGRLGRMVIPLLMCEHGLIRLPVFGLSTRIAVRRGFYYDGLLGVSRSDDWTGWCLYFLDAVSAPRRKTGSPPWRRSWSCARRPSRSCRVSRGPGTSRRRSTASLRARCSR